MPNTLSIALQNHTSSNTVYAYITGLAIQNDSAWFILQADGITPYFPTSPSADQSPLTENCAIALGASGNTRTVTIPQLAGGRIWFSIDKPLTFLLNRGPQLVQPSVFNPSDPNFNSNWAFCEFTFNSDQLFANISYVDFVSIPVALTLQNASGGIQHVSGMPPTGLDTVCAGLRAQTKRDGKAWDKLIVTQNGKNLRALSPNNASVNGGSFADYYEAYAANVWQKYTHQTMRVNTQSGPGILNGQVTKGQLVFAGQEFQQPTTADIFSCSTGPFVTGSDSARDAIIARLAAAFNRSTLLTETNFPADPSTFYKTSPTNHYSRIVHAANLDGKGYAFPYDDVQPDGGVDQSGKVNDGNPQLFTVTVGGMNAYAGDRLPPFQHDELKRDEPVAAAESATPTSGDAPAPAPAPEDQAQAPEPRRRSSVFQRIQQRFFGRK